MPTAAIGVLAVQGDVREHRRALERSGARVVTVRRAADLAGVDGVVVPGGESTTIGKLCATFGVLGPLQEAVRAGLPVYGSCAGMILLADAVVDGRPDQPLIGGLDVVVRRNAFGRQVDSFEADVPLRGVPGGPIHGVFIRAPEVTTVGPGVAVLGRVGAAGGAGRIVAVRQGPLLATSFHPELTGDARVHALFVDMVKGRA